MGVVCSGMTPPPCTGSVVYDKYTTVKEFISFNRRKYRIHAGHKKRLLCDSKQSRTYKPVLNALIGVFLKLVPLIWMSSQARNTLNKEIRVAKRSYAKKLENQFSSNDPASVWKGLKDITNYKTPSPSTEANQQLAEDLNEFYCRFETAGLTPHAPSEHLSTQPLTPPATPLSPPPALRISEDDVRQIFLKQKRRKAPGPDGVTPACLKTCADQLAFIFSQIFNRSLELCEVPACFKHSTIIPIPKKPKITGLNDYRPVALTSVVMKSFERLVLAYLKNITGPLLDPLQFAY
ncbi:hypothetical protein QTP70_009986 [Hemibagrus guttatus]|uniref:Reverse transcriptase domain-containing protein n=1 Tax=Hemibagrus guttatus TaxID=175788 RepID=A0AAE0UL22_9TELE|nr:hypothetical protein QTP70_009986 [Hemibagrus guttatus]